MAEDSGQQDQKEPFEIRLEVSAKGIRAHYPESRVLEVLGAMAISRSIIVQKATGKQQPKSSSLVMPQGPLPRM